MGKHAVKTTWRMKTYDVWGNAQDGYNVNDVYDRGEIELYLRIQTNNQGTPQEFQSAYPSKYQVGRVLGTRSRLDLDGDDLVVYVNRQRDGYPLGELRCTSHQSLSPIRKTNNILVMVGTKDNYVLHSYCQDCDQTREYGVQVYGITGTGNACETCGKIPE